MENFEELWVQHPEFTRYWISNKGRIKTYIKSAWRIKTLDLTNRGYIRVLFCNNGKRKWFSVHRLVAEFFLPKSQITEVVNHIDFNKKNNFYTNLEWCTQKENVFHADLNNRRFKKPVKQLDFNRELIKIHRSAHEAEKSSNGEFKATNISKCCRGIYKQHKGFIWNFLHD